MSFNLRYRNDHDGQNGWPHRKDLVLEVIRTEAPDVIGVQEALHPQLKDLDKALPAYAQIGEGRDGGDDGEHAAILYRRERLDVEASGTFWLSDTPEEPSADWGNDHNRICTWARLTEASSGKSITVYNTHWDHRSQSSRQRSARLISERMAGQSPPCPCVLLGDLNAAEDNPALRYLCGRGESAVPLRDSFRVLHRDATEAGTFHDFTGAPNGARIDYILVSDGVRPIEAAILRTHRDGRYPSDHFPITARVRVE